MSHHAALEARRERAARNQSLFRELNERIEARSTTASFVEFVCECADQSCDAKVSLTLEEYEQVRSHPNRFIVLRGHNLVDVETIVVAADGYYVVSKLGVGGEVARELDPRS